jgi:hypothetical protein
MSRKIIQLITKSEILIALCDDGTVWKLVRNCKAGYGGDAYDWEQFTNIPGSGV